MTPRAKSFSGASCCRWSEFRGGGGAVWLVEPKDKDQPPDFQLESFLDLSKSGFDFGFDPLTPGVLSCLQQVFNTRQKLVVYPHAGRRRQKGRPTRTRRDLPGFSAASIFAAACSG